MATVPMLVTPLRGRPSVGHMVIPYVQGLGGTLNTFGQNMEYRHMSKETGPSSSFW